METRSRGYFGKTDLVEYVWLTGVCVVKGKVYLKLAFNHWLALELAGSRDQTVPPQRGEEEVCGQDLKKVFRPSDRGR